jgi:hypothetical protein
VFCKENRPILGIGRLKAAFRVISGASPQGKNPEVLVAGENGKRYVGRYDPPYPARSKFNASSFSKKRTGRVEPFGAEVVQLFGGRGDGLHVLILLRLFSG